MYILCSRDELLLWETILYLNDPFHLNTVQFLFLDKNKNKFKYFEAS